MAVNTGRVLLAEFSQIHPGAQLATLTREEQAQVEADRAATDSDDPGTGTDEQNHAERQARAGDAQDQAIYFKSVHALSGGQSALCLSGGGIRSAAFSLGALQGLARHKLLSQFDYLSTVSGGGYTGSWLTAWAHRHALLQDKAGSDGAASFEEIEALLASRPDHATREIPPFRWLRRNQRFLNPRAGFLSADLWATLALFLRDLILNWLVYFPAIAALMLTPRLAEAGLILWTAIAYSGGSSFGWAIVSVLDPTAIVAHPGWPGFSDLVGAGLVLFGMSVAGFYRTSTERPGLTDGRFVFWVLSPIMLGAMVLVAFNSAILAAGASPDRTLRNEWWIGVPLAYVVGRVIGAGFKLVLRGQPGSWLTSLANLGLELFFLGVGGFVTGSVIVFGLLLHFQYSQCTPSLGDLVVLGVPYLLVAFVLGQIAYAGLSNRSSFGHRDREWQARASGFYLLAAVGWAVVSGLVIYGQPLQQRLLSVFLVSGTAGTFTLAAATSTFSKATAAFAAARERVSFRFLIQAGAFIFVVGGAVTLTAVTQYLIQQVSGVDIQRTADLLSAEVRAAALAYVQQPGATVVPQAAAYFETILLWTIGLCALSFLLSLIIDVNAFSLHALYRNRLIRTFLGATNPKPERNLFDGFSDNDDLYLDVLWSKVQGSSASAQPQPEPPAPMQRRREGPFPIINIALNLVGAKDNAWQERKAAPFVATPLCVGADVVGYIGHDRSAKRRHLSLGTAMAISGAAASPNWGYHSSPLVGFLMMLFNIRLGWWLENPKKAEAGHSPFRSFRLFIQEALGQTSADDAYVYLSDGGHFDNLGIYEMLRRRCRLILVIDASQDQNYDFADLGRSLRLAAVDLGIGVEFAPIAINKRTDPASPGVYAATASITYPEHDWTEGRAATLIYLKPGFFADAPADVRAYAGANPAFPHDNTFNQWFTESQFESYRALGAHVVSHICGVGHAEGGRISMSDLPDLVRAYLEAAEPSEPGLAKAGHR